MATAITLQPGPARGAHASFDGSMVFHTNGHYFREYGEPEARPYLGAHELFAADGRKWICYFSRAIVDDFGDLVEVAS